MMKISINKKYSFFFGISSAVIMLILVSSFAFIMVKKGADLRKNVKSTGADFYRESHGKTLFNTAQYLGRHLYNPVYQTDIARVNRIINDMKIGLPYNSFVVADARGRILTDGTRENKAFGTRLDTDLARLKQEPIIADKTGQDERITFAIRSDRHVAGYGQIVYSNEPLLASIEKLHALFDSGWREFRTVFLRISMIGIATALVVAALMSYLFSGTISRPLLRLKEAADRVARGDLDCRVEIDTNDEIGALAASFNRMVADLKRSTEQLHEANRQLFERSITDRLTGLSNYAHFMDELQKEEARARRSKSNFGVILFDLDLFKTVNDTWGHEKGNLLLKAVADILKANARRMDTVARYGGEEFALLMPDSQGAEREVAERIRRKIESTEFTGIVDAPLRITISGGVCTYPRDGRSVAELLDNADKGLYQAKNSGRNKTCWCEPPGDPQTERGQQADVTG
jgi:diguanylate cyclase (GGDEF)-like protein